MRASPRAEPYDPWRPKPSAEDIASDGRAPKCNKGNAAERSRTSTGLPPLAPEASASANSATAAAFNSKIATPEEPLPFDQSRRDNLRSVARIGKPTCSPITYCGVIPLGPSSFTPQSHEKAPTGSATLRCETARFGRPGRGMKDGSPNMPMNGEFALSRAGNSPQAGVRYWACGCDRRVLPIALATRIGGRRSVADVQGGTAKHPASWLVESGKSLRRVSFYINPAYSDDRHSLLGRCWP